MTTSPAAHASAGHKVHECKHHALTCGCSHVKSAAADSCEGIAPALEGPPESLRPSKGAAKRCCSQAWTWDPFLKIFAGPYLRTVASSKELQKRKD